MAKHLRMVASESAGRSRRVAEAQAAPDEFLRARAT